MAKYKVYSKSKLFKLTPKWRWILLMLISSLSFMIDDWRFYVANLAITLTLSCLTNVSYSQLCKPIRSCFYLLVMVFVMHTICRDWVYGIYVILRFCNMALFASWAFYPISHLDSIEGLEALLKPMSFIGFNPAKVSLSLALAMRFVPLIIDTLQEVEMAQKAKGIHKHFMAMLVPSIIKTIKMAEDIAEAIEARSWE